MKSTRRTFLESIGLTTAVTLSGCQEMLSGSGQPEEQDTATPTPQETASPKPTPKLTSTPEQSSNNKATPTPAEYQQEGSLHVKTRDGIIGTDGHYDQGEIGDNPDNLLELIIEVDPEDAKDYQENPDNWTIKPWTDPTYTPETGETEEILLSTQELRERYQHNQYLQTIQEIDIPNELNEQETKEMLRKLPHKLDDHEWLTENLFNPYLKSVGNENYPISTREAEEFWDIDIFNQGDNLKKRVTESNYTQLWKITELYTLGRVSSVNDFLKADILSAAEYHTAGKQTATFNMKTNTGAHGLAWAIENPTYKQNSLDQQETWIFETDPNRNKWFIDLDEKEEYTQGENTWISKPELHEEGGKLSWKQYGIPVKIEDILEVNYEDSEKHTDFLLDPETQPGMQYVDSACIAAYINEHAAQGERLEDWESITVHPDQIEYQLN